MAYREGLQSGIRKQLGFAFKDISEHLPGAFIIYRADKDDDELFYANHEFLHMTGYKDMDELFRLTNKRFRNLILKDEQKQIESSIWEQIDSGNENDYIHFHLRKADGSYLSVLDHGRIVKASNTEGCSMYYSWTGKICIFITVINFPNNNRHTTVFHEKAYFQL